MNSFKKLKSFNSLKSFKNLSFYSQDSNQILEALRLLHRLDYVTVDGCFNTEEAVTYNGLCAWSDGDISEGWLIGNAGFRQVTLEELKEMVDEGIKDNVFTLERLLGCEVLFGDTLYYVHYIYHSGAVGHLVLETDTRRAYVSDFSLLTFFTEDGDELTFDEYVQLYYPKG